MHAEDVLAWLDTHETESLDRLIEWLRLPSIGTDPAYNEKTRAAGEWARAQLESAGLTAELRETGSPEAPGHPIVWATSPGAPDYKGPHILFYGHYDVQPPDPIELWRSGPFDPVIEGDGDDRRIVARGACDDKGQVMMFLEALQAWHAVRGEPAGGVRFTVLLEGEEESGSENLERFLEDHRDKLRACDVCVISDTGMLSTSQPAITYGVRGLAYTEVTLHAANQDLHSGLWGGRAPNPANDLARVLGQLWDDQNRVTIPGFYDGVLELTQGEREAWAALPFSQSDALAKIGLPPEADRGEAGFTALEREWARPTADINGILTGYTGEGAKTVIAASAMAKVSFRLVANQDPEQIVERFFAWLDERTPPGCRWEKEAFGHGNPATVATDSPHLAAATRAIEAATGTAPVLIKSGGSIPVAGLLKAGVGLDTVFMGFGLDDDRVHSPNEKFELACFRMGARSHVLLIDTLRES